jgi:hypothetical protein
MTFPFYRRAMMAARLMLIFGLVRRLLRSLRFLAIAKY